MPLPHSAVEQRAVRAIFSAGRLMERAAAVAILSILAQCVSWSRAAAAADLAGENASSPARAVAANAAPVSIGDVTGFKRFEFIQLPPDERWVAYLLKEPDVRSNVNELVLYIASTGRPMPQPIVTFRTRAADSGVHGEAVLQLE